MPPLPNRRYLLLAVALLLALGGVVAGLEQLRAQLGVPVGGEEIERRVVTDPLGERVIEELADGVSHHRLVTIDGQVVNVIYVDLGRGAGVTGYKALDCNDGLERACDIADRARGSLRDTVLAAANASFWRAGSNTPIGVTVSAGHLIEMSSYKSWSSLLIYEDGTAAIERVRMEGRASWRGKGVSIDGANRRGKNDGVVLYNTFYGDSLPRGSRRSDSAIIADAVANKVGTGSGDETEGEIDTAALIREYREERLREDREHGMTKVVLRTTAPRRRRVNGDWATIDRPMKMVVLTVDTGVVQIPEDGLVLSLGDVAGRTDLPRSGDTIEVTLALSPRQSKPVRDVLTATPRLVREGKAGPEHEIEGSKNRRFVSSELARTAIGISRGGDTLIVATVDSPERSEGRRGMSLAQLASLMRDLGAWDAMNFDGGGSASMSVRGTMISRQGEGPSRRRVSNALLVVKKPAKRERGAAASRPSYGGGATEERLEGGE